MKPFPFLFPLLLLLYFPVTLAHAEESIGNAPGIPFEFKSEIERFRSLAHETVSMNPQTDPSLLNYETGLNFFHIGDGYSAIQTLKGLLAATSVSESLRKEVHLTLGYVYLEQNRPKEALEEFTPLEKEAFFREKAKFGIAWSLMQIEEYVKAIAIFEELVKEYPEGDYAPEALSKIGYCYSRLLSYKNAVASYEKAMHVYNKRLQAQNDLLLASAQSIPFQRSFIFDNPDPNWKFFFRQIRNNPHGIEMIQGADDFFNLEDRLNKSPALRQESPQYPQNRAQVRTHIQNLFLKFIHEQIKEMRQILQDLSTDLAVELARNLVLEQTPAGQKSGSP